MIRSYWLYVRPDLPGNLSKSVDALTTVHAVAGPRRRRARVVRHHPRQPAHGAGARASRATRTGCAPPTSSTCSPRCWASGSTSRSTDDRGRHVTTTAASSVLRPAPPRPERRRPARPGLRSSGTPTTRASSWRTGYLVATGRGPYSPLDLARGLPPRRLLAADHDRLPAALAAGRRGCCTGLTYARRAGPAPLRPGAQAAGDRGHRRARLPRGRGAAAGRGPAGDLPQGLGLPALQPAHPLRRRRLGADRRDRHAARRGGAGARLAGTVGELGRAARPGRLHQADAAAGRAGRARLARRARAPREALRYAAVFARLGRRLPGRPRRGARLAHGADPGTGPTRTSS